MTQFARLAGRTLVASMLLSNGATAGTDPLTGDLDPTFSADGWTTFAISANDDGQDVAVLPDGRLAAVFAQAVSPANGRLRVDTSGLGESFTEVDFAVNPGAGPVGTFPEALVAQADGKLVVAGTTFESPSRGFVARFTVDAAGQPALDGGFGTGGFARISPGSAVRLHDVAVDSQGRIVAVGAIDLAAGADTDFLVVRLTTLGQPDTDFRGDGRQTVAFNLGGVRPDEGVAVAIDGSDRVVVAGRASSSATASDFALCRLLAANGGLDPSFDGDGRATVGFDLGGTDDDQADGVALDAAGKILVAGRARDADGTGHVAALARLTTAGVLDDSFSADGRLTTAFGLAGANDSAQGKDVLATPDGTLLLGERLTLDLTVSDLALAAFDPAGDFDPDFGLFGFRIYNLGAYEKLWGATLQSGRPVLAGERSQAALIARIHVAPIFTDGFESGGTRAWSGAAP
jgi:uncharacterized delta-60 repeat protein